jgi:hypothetical protein
MGWGEGLIAFYQNIFNRIVAVTIKQSVVDFYSIHCCCRIQVLLPLTNEVLHVLNRFEDNYDVYNNMVVNIVSNMIADLIVKCDSIMSYLNIIVQHDSEIS